jgi:phage shock protein PspC (stress-responsive transcriptional regulator)
VSLADELSRLEELRSRGTLSDEEFQRAKARLLEAPPAGTASNEAVAAIQRFRRSRSDRWIGGVCGGVAAITGIESWVWRLMVTVLFLFGGTGALLYILLWIFVPNE